MRTYGDPWLTADSESRLVVACEKIADALERLATIHEKRLAHDFPPRREPREAVITTIPSPEDELRESQGATGEPLEEWLGEHEKELLDS